MTKQLRFAWETDISDRNLEEDMVTGMRRVRNKVMYGQNFKTLERSTGLRQTFSKTRHCSAFNDDQRCTFLKK